MPLFWELEIHSTNATKSLAYCCDLCGLVTASSHSLQYHLTTHEKTKDTRFHPYKAASKPETPPKPITEILPSSVLKKYDTTFENNETSTAMILGQELGSKVIHFAPTKSVASPPTPAPPSTTSLPTSSSSPFSPPSSLPASSSFSPSSHSCFSPTQNSAPERASASPDQPTTTSTSSSSKQPSPFNDVPRLHCTHCTYKCLNKDDLNRHLSIHRRRPTFRCPSCPAAYTTANQLNCHLKVHLSKTSLVCDICGCYFTTQNNLVRHYLTHTGEKPYKCEFCNKRFRQSGDCNRHKRVKHRVSLSG